MLRYLVRLTPPFGTNPFTETFGAQLRAGREAVRRDIEKGFEPINQLEMFTAPTSRTGIELRRLVRQGRLVEASELARRVGIRTGGFIDTVDSDSHKRLRNRRGRVTTRNPFIVTRSASVGQRIRRVQQRVGFAKAGWMATARRLRLSLPQWISRNSTPGLCTETGVGTPRYTITMENRVRFGMRFETSIVPAALRRLQGSINRQYTAILNRRHARRRG